MPGNQQLFLGPFKAGLTEGAFRSPNALSANNLILAVIIYPLLNTIYNNWPALLRSLIRDFQIQYRRP